MNELHAADAADPRVEEILSLFAHEARIDRSLLRLDARPDDLGVASLDLALALFAIEDRFNITLPSEAPAGAAMPTVGELVQQVLDAIGPLAATLPEGANPRAKPLAQPLV